MRLRNSPSAPTLPPFGVVVASGSLIRRALNPLLKAFLAALFVAVSLCPANGAESRPREVRRAAPIPPVIDEVGTSSFGAASGVREQPRPIMPSGPEPVASTDARSRAETPSAALPNTMAGLNDKRRIGIRDRLSLNIIEDELPARQLVVTDSGEVDVPYIGRISVGERTCKQLALYIKGLLEREYYHQATVLIGLDAAGGQVMSRGRYYVNGQVGRPGPYELPMDEVLTVSKAIMRAGGFNQYASKKKVRLLRKETARTEAQTFILDLVEIMEKGRTSGDMELLPEDIIYVDEKFFNF